MGLGGGGRGPHAACRLKFHYFVGFRLKLSTFQQSVVDKSQLIFFWGGGGGEGSTCCLSVKISLLCPLSVKIFVLCRLSVNLS